jgi:hypothetical protein
LTQAARHALAQLERLALAWRRWHDQLGSRRETSRLAEVLHLAAILPALSAAFVARRLATPARDCPARGASFPLRELAAEGILAEITGRRSWRLFVPADLAYLRQLERFRGALAIGRQPASAMIMRERAEETAKAALPPITGRPRLVMTEPVEADWAALMADIDQATLKAAACLDRIRPARESAAAGKREET